MKSSRLFEYQTKYFCIIKYSQPNKKTFNYVIVNNTMINIGEIKWYAPWRKYCFFPSSETVWDSKCLNLVKEYLDKFNEEHKKLKNTKE